MSNAPQGRGRGGGRGKPRRDQPPTPSSGRGSGRSNPNPPHSTSLSQFPPLGAAAQFSPLGSPSPSSVTHDFQQKLKVGQPRGPPPAQNLGQPRAPMQAQTPHLRAPGQVAQARAPQPARPLGQMAVQPRAPPPSGQAPQVRSQIQAHTGQMAQARPIALQPRPVVQLGQVAQSRPPTQTGQVVQARPSAQQPGQPSRQVVQPRAPTQTGQVVGPNRAPTSSKAITLPARPGLGTLGRKCTVKANHFLVQVSDRELYHYDVTIMPEVTSKKVCRLIMQELATCYRESHLGKRHIAYDGVKSMYTAGELPFSSKDFVIKIDKDDNTRRDREFKVAIKFAAKPDLHHLQQFLLGRQLDSPQETIQVLDVVLRSKPSIDYTVVGRSFFDKVLGGTGSLTEGLEYWKGFYQSLRPTQMGLSLNIDVSARAFFEPILLTEFAARFCNVRNLTRPLSDQDRIKLKKALRGIKVLLVTNEGGRRYKINGFTPQPLRQLTFINDTGAKTSVIQYFREKYNVNPTLTALPAVQAGNDSKPVYLPMELCKIVSGQRYTKKLSEKQVTALLRATCQRPVDREDSIKRMVMHNNYNHDVVANDFGIQVNGELASVEARVLPPPQLQYMGTQETPRVGSWNMMKKKMVNGARIDFWTCVNFSSLEPRGVEIFCGALVNMCQEKGIVNMCQEKGIVFHPRPIIPSQSASPSQIRATLSDIDTKSKEQIASVGHDGKQLQLLIIILPDIKGSYGNIKLICETELGIVSQCCQGKQAYKCNGQYLENLSLKINVKAGGRNTVLLNAIQKKMPKITDKPTIIFGADVTHPSPGEDSSPSIAAVVASMDWPEVTKYRAVVSAQQHRDEIIHDLYTCTQNAQGLASHAGMIREHLMAFLKSTRLKPQRIIFYRDGVSEGQFSQVLLYEMDAIRKACMSLESDYLPPVTFLVVQKRHHTRLFAANHNDRNSIDKSGNILPGTVIDTTICHPTEFDWYLNSHAGIQGTSRPAHYHVLFDENNFSADELQSLTNNLCYTYARCTRSVSIVPAAYYAHLAAFRARYYMEGNATSDGESVSGSGTRERAVDVCALPKIKDNVKEVMFYC